MRRIPLSLLSLLVSLPLFAQQIIIQPQQPGAKPQKRTLQISPEQVNIDRARREEQRGNFEAALAAWQQALSASPWNPAAVQGVLSCLNQLRRFDDAVKFLDERMQMTLVRSTLTDWQDPTGSFMLSLSRGEVELQRGDEDSAWKFWRDALSTQPNNPEAMRSLVSILQKNHRWEDSDKLIRDYRKDAKVPGFMSLELASSLQAQMNFAGASEELLLYCKTSPTAWQIAQSYFSRFPDDSTVERTVLHALENAVKRDKKDPTLWRVYSGYAMKAGRLALALDATVAADSLGENGGQLVLSTTQQLLQEGDVTLARKGFEKVLDWEPAEQFTERAELGLAQCHEAQGQFAEAKQAYQRYLESHPKSPESDEARFHIAEILLTSENNPQASLLEFESIWQRGKAPLKIKAGLRAGDAHAYNKDFGGAIEAWSRVTRLTSGNITEETADAFLRIARANMWRDSTTLATSALDTILKGSTLNSAFNDAILYQALLEGGGFQGAMRAFADADYAEFRNDCARASEKFGEAANLLHYGRLAEWTRLSQAQALRECGKPDEALAALDTFAVNFPESVELPHAKYLQAVIILEDLKNDDEALRLLEDYLIQYPRSLYLEQARRKARILANKIS
jgi:outer membrane protein assembly factor BamD (BamD/ComL family)